VGAGTYSKPSGGIPDSDIASASTWNAKGTYSKPSGGIPASDLASAVQTSLDKADTAYQKTSAVISEEYDYTLITKDDDGVTSLTGYIGSNGNIMGTDETGGYRTYIFPIESDSFIYPDVQTTFVRFAIYSSADISSRNLVRSYMQSETPTRDNPASVNAGNFAAVSFRPYADTTKYCNLYVATERDYILSPSLPLTATMQAEVAARAAAAAPVQSVNGQTGAVSLTIPSTAADVGAEPATTEVTISTAGAVTQALDAGKIYHFTGALTALTVTATDPMTGKYQFDFMSGSTAPTLTVPASWVMPDNFLVEPSARYSLSIQNGYCSLEKWSDSHSPFIYLDDDYGDFVINSNALINSPNAYANVGTEVSSFTISGRLKSELGVNASLKLCDISAKAKALMGSTYVAATLPVGNGKVVSCTFNTWQTSSQVSIKNDTGAALAANTLVTGTIFILRTI
jgi:hypothetical protein